MRIGILALLVLVIAGPVAATPHEAPIAANFDGGMLHRASDVLALFEPDALPAPERAALLQSDHEQTQDFIDFRHSAWIGDYAFAGPRLRVMSSLQVFPTDALARNDLADAERNIRAGVGENAQRLEAIGRPTAARRDGSYHVIRNGDGTPVGNVLFVREGRRWYKVLIGGVYLEEVGDIEAFLEPKLTKALAFEPDFGGMTPTEAGMEPMRKTLSSFTLPLFLLMLVAYWVARGGAALVNQRRPGRQYSGRTLGVALVLALACLAIAGAHWLLIVDGARVFELLPPVEQGRLSGAAIATGLLPALYVLVPVGIAAWLRRKPDIAQRPMG